MADTYGQVATARNAITVDYDELDGSPTEAIDKDGNFTANRKLRCAWADRMTLITQLRGYWTFNEATGDLTWHQPQQYPWRRGLVCNGARTVPMGAQVTDADRTESTTVAEYYYCTISVSYAPPEEEDSEDDGDEEYTPKKLFTERLEPRMDMMLLESRPLGWRGTGGPEPIDPISIPPMQVPACTWVIEREKLPGLIEDVFKPPSDLGLVGAVNNKLINSPTLRFWVPKAGGGITRSHVQFNAGTLLFEPPLFQREIVTDKIGMWKASFRLHYKPTGWNYFPKIGANGTGIDWTPYSLLSKCVVGNDPPTIEVYPLADFDDLLKLMFVYTGVPVKANE